MTRLAKEDLQGLPIFLLEKLRDTAQASLWDVAMQLENVMCRLEEPQIMFTEPDLIYERDRLQAEGTKLRLWLNDLYAIIQEPRTLFERVAIDDPLNPEAPV